MTFANSELADSNVHDRFVASSSVLDVLDSFYGFGLLLTLAAAGFVLARNRGPLYLLLAMIVTMALTMSLFFIFGRYRLAIVPMLIVSAAALAQLPEIVRRRSWKKCGLALFAAAAAVGWVTLAEEAIPADAHGLNAYNRAKYLNDHGRLNDAEALYRRAIEQNPRLSAAYNNLGLLLADRGELQRAAPLLSQAIQLEPNDPDAQINYGMVLARQNEYADAIEHFRQALKLDPNNTAARYNLAAGLMMQGHNPEAIDLRLHSGSRSAGFQPIHSPAAQ